MSTPVSAAPLDSRPLRAAGVAIGIGMGGFVDGILLHQILQIHNMLSARLPPDSLVNVEINMVWDGLFHAFTWCMTAVGIALLWKAARTPTVSRSTPVLVGAMLQGWGWFNLVEGIIDHHILHLHHVVERLGTSIYDYLFLASGVLFILIGERIMRSGRTSDPSAE